MTNWKKCTYGDRVRLTDVDGDVFEGIVESVIALEERSDLEKPEDGIDIIVEDGRHIGFYESEISEIVVVKLKTQQNVAARTPA